MLLITTFVLWFFSIFIFTNDLLYSVVIKTEDLFMIDEPNVKSYLSVKKAENILENRSINKIETLRTIEMDELSPILLYKTLNPESEFGLLTKDKLILIHTLENSIIKDIESREDKICVATSKTNQRCPDDRIRSIM